GPGGRAGCGRAAGGAAGRAAHGHGGLGPGALGIADPHGVDHVGDRPGLVQPAGWADRAARAILGQAEGLGPDPAAGAEDLALARAELEAARAELARAAGGAPARPDRLGRPGCR